LSTTPSTAEHPASVNGSGFFVSQEGHVITALHVVRAAEQVREQMRGTDNRLFVGLRAGSSFVAVPAEVVGVDEPHASPT
jgi:S1-C subfamily serine protease